MNAVQSRLLDDMEAEVEGMGVEEFKLHALRNLKMKTVVKESHKCPIQCVAWNHINPAMNNLVATVGGDQATVYDDRHMGQYMAVVVHFSNVKTAHHAGGALDVCCWICDEGVTHHPHGDACLAVAGSDPTISIISVAEARVVSLLKGHTNKVVELRSCQSMLGLLVSLSEDGNLRIWDVPNTSCLASIKTDAWTMDLDPACSSIITGSTNSSVQLWRLTASRVRVTGGGDPLNLTAPSPSATVYSIHVAPKPVPGCHSSKEEDYGDPSPVPLTLPGCQNESWCPETLTLPGCQKKGIECVRFLPGHRLAVKYCSGHLSVWLLSAVGKPNEQMLEILVPGGGRASPNRELSCPFSFTSDAAFLCVGNAEGHIFVYRTTDGETIGHVSSTGIQESHVRSCVVADDCRHLLAAIGHGFLFRFEYLMPESSG